MFFRANIESCTDASPGVRAVIARCMCMFLVQGHETKVCFSKFQCDLDNGLLTVYVNNTREEASS